MSHRDGHSTGVMTVVGRARLGWVVAFAIGCGSSPGTGRDAGGRGGAAGTGGAAGAAGGRGGAGGAAGRGGAGMAGGGGTDLAGSGGSGGASGGGRGGAAGMGSAGNAGTGGAAGSGGAAAGGATAGTSGGAAGGASGGGGAGGGGRGGTGESGRGGAGGTGVAGTGGGGGGGGAGAAGTGEPLSVTAALDGQKYMMPCGREQSTSWLVCENFAPGPTRSCPYLGPYLTRGYVMRDDTVTVAGAAGAIYDVTLRVRGVVEPKHFTGGAKGDPANGTNYSWYVGGEPSQAGTYSVYMLWVSAPVVAQTGTLDGQYYFLNAVDHYEAHFTYPLDYTVTLPIAAGAQVRFFADDSNCSMVKNCDDTSRDGITIATAICNPSTIADLPTSSGIAQPYPGQFIYLTVVSAVMR